ncbi:MAG: undecaprenyldiphospho-muramoylpentapeptide beta-N-acetylglucosaminyltransferase [Rickettsiales bacterium]|nr:undecaprenyldiphospho-muramoylpentapeptide beta-N-acetylglucosaminyltransferase [Rickettsiales bacterium]
MKEKRIKPKIFLATGGSGGHIFPALSVANELTKDSFSVCVIADKVFEKYANNNINNRIINAGKTLHSFSDIKEIIKGVFQSRHLIKQEKPNLVVGFGSYATLPVLIACLLTKTPFILHEQNTYIGKINKLFARYAKKVMTSYHELYGINYNDMEKIIYTGSPVRKEIQKLNNILYKYPVEEKFNVLITGGSSGAEIFSEYLPKIFDFSHKGEQKKIKVYHQVREEYLDQVKEYYKKINVEAIVSTFFKNMDELLEKSHLIIGRSGSGTLNETAIAGKPSILIPLKNSANNHQEINAKMFEKNGASIVVLEKNFNIKDFQKTFFDLVKNRELLESMAKNAKSIAVVDADVQIANVIIDILHYNQNITQE